MLTITLDPISHIRIDAIGLSHQPGDQAAMTLHAGPSSSSSPQQASGVPVRPSYLHRRRASQPAGLASRASRTSFDWSDSDGFEWSSASASSSDAESDDDAVFLRRLRKGKDREVDLDYVSGVM